MSDNLNFLEQRLPDLKGRRQLQALDEIAADFENIHMAWDWAMEQGQYDVSDQVIEALWLCMLLGGLRIVVRPLFEKVYEDLKPSGNERPHPLWTKVVPRYAYFSHNIEEVEQSLHLAKQRDDQAEVAFCLMMLGQLKRSQREYTASLAYLQQSLAGYQTLGDQFHEAQLLGYIGACYQFAGEQEQSIAYTRRSQDLSRQIGDVIGTADQSHRMGVSMLIIGNYEEAEQLFQEAEQHGTVAAFRPFLKLVRGQLEAAVNEAERQLQWALDTGGYDVEQLSRIILAMVANLKGNYVDARQQLQAVKWTRAAQLFADWGLAVAFCGIGDFASARQYIASGVEGAGSFNSLAWQAMFLPPLAVVLANEEQPEKAAQVLGLAYAHPASATGWLQQWSLLSYTTDGLKTALEQKVFAEATAIGQNMMLEVALLY